MGCPLSRTEPEEEEEVDTIGGSVGKIDDGHVVVEDGGRGQRELELREGSGRSGNGHNRVKSAWERKHLQSVSNGGPPPTGLSKFASLTFHQQKFLQKVASKRYSPDVGHLDYSQRVFTNNSFEENSLDESWNSKRITTDQNIFEPDIIDLQQTYLKTLKNRVICNAESQTDPVQEEAFDWDLSDRTEAETQTVPSSRSNSGESRKTRSSQTARSHNKQDEIVQTDQRLVFLLRRATTSNKGHQTKKSNSKGVDIGVQTNVETANRAVQVITDELEPGELGAATKIDASTTTTKTATNELEQQQQQVLDKLASATSDKQRKVLAAVRKRLSESGGQSNNDIVDTDSDSEYELFSKQSDAGLQVNLATDAEIAVADHTHRPDISSPVGTVLQKSLHFADENDSKHTPASNAFTVRVAPSSSTTSALSNNDPFRRLGAKPKKSKSNVVKVDVGIQTANDIVTDESPTFKAIPSTLRKYEVIGDDPNLFQDIDAFVVDLSRKRYKSLKKIVKIILAKIEKDSSEDDDENYPYNKDLIKIRAFFRWVTENISYDSSYLDTQMTTADVLREGKGVCRQYVKIFSEMCEMAHIKVKNIKGFAKGPNYMPGDDFFPGESTSHAWNAVFISKAWRLLDCTWGSGKLDQEGNFLKELNEHFFLTDPDELIFTHFPYDEVEANYSKWQLLSQPVTLATFNTMPLLTPNFFEYSLRLGKELDPMKPIVIRGDTKKDEEVEDEEDHLDLRLWAWEVIRYKYKFFEATEQENDYLNKFIMCYLKGRQRKLAVFRISPPETKTFFLKIYAKPEEEIIDENDTLDHVATFLIHAVQIPFTPLHFPRSDLPYGLTDAFQETEAVLVGHAEPFIHMFGDKETKIVFKTPFHRIISLCHIYDSEGNELVIDSDKEMQYTVLLNKTNMPVEIEKDEETTIKPFIVKKENERETVFVIGPLPKPGHYKLQIFARKKPHKRGKLRVPLVASFLVDYHQSKNKEQTKFQGTSITHAASRKLTTMRSILGSSSAGSSRLANTIKGSTERLHSGSRKSINIEQAQREEEQKSVTEFRTRSRMTSSETT